MYQLDTSERPIFALGFGTYAWSRTTMSCGIIFFPPIMAITGEYRSRWDRIIIEESEKLRNRRFVDAFKDLEAHRYRNILPFDENRVRLSPKYPDTILNSSWIDTGLKTFIATQAPLGNRMLDFWRMCEVHNVRLVVVLATSKIDIYWPSSRDTPILQQPGYSVKLIKDIPADIPHNPWTLRHLLVELNTSAKSFDIAVLQFNDWPDLDIPKNLDSFLAFMLYYRKLRNAMTPEKTNTVVHCSAGVGRTGTFITLDHLYTWLATTGSHNQESLQEEIDHVIRKLKSQRCYMVQTYAQYQFIHEALSIPNFCL